MSGRSGLFQKRINDVYHKNKVYHPDGHFMFFCSDKKIDFYLIKKNLAELLSTTTDENGKVIREIKLTFVPNGPGCTTEYDLTEKINQCVVCGETEGLTQHHVVPYMYSKYFPNTLKGNNSHDVLVMTEINHMAYEEYAAVFKDKLAIEYGAMTIKQYQNSKFAELSIPYNKKRSLRGIAYLLSRPAKMAEIPEWRQNQLIQEFVDLSGLEPIHENFVKIASIMENFKLDIEYGKYFMDFISDLNEFCVSWRKHFVDTMNPQFLPAGWSIYGNKKGIKI